MKVSVNNEVSFEFDVDKFIEDYLLTKDSSPYEIAQSIEEYMCGERDEVRYSQNSYSTELINAVCESLTKKNKKFEFTKRDMEYLYQRYETEGNSNIRNRIFAIIKSIVMAEARNCVWNESDKQN